MAKRRQDERLGHKRGHWDDEDGDWDDAQDAPERPLGQGVEHLQIAIADMGRSVGNRPTAIWGQYYNAHGELVGVDILKQTTHRGKLGPGDFYIPPAMSVFLGGNEKAAQLKTSDVHYLRNEWRTTMHATDNALSHHYLPDLILRRTYSILFDKREQDAGAFSGETGLNRYGIAFNQLAQIDAAAPGFIPEAYDAPFEQTPLIIPEYLSQDDIETIFNIAKITARSALQRVCRLYGRSLDNGAHGQKSLWPSPLKEKTMQI